MYLYWSVRASYQEAVIWFEQLNRFPSLKEDKTWVLTRFYLAVCEGELGLSRRAEQHFVDNINLAREISSEHLVLGLQSYAAFLSDANRHAEAIPLLEECLRTNSTQENKEYHTNVQLNSLAIAFYALGDVDRAVGFFEQRLEILRKFGSPFEVAFAALNCGVVLLMNHQKTKAIPLLVEALATFQQNGSLEGQRVALLALGRDALDSDPRAALVRFDEILETNPELNSEIRNKALLGRGIGYAKLGQVKVAVDVWVDVFRTAIASSALERITEAFEFLLYFLAESVDNLSAPFGLQLIGWYTVFFESVSAHRIVK